MGRIGFAISFSVAEAPSNKKSSHARWARKRFFPRESPSPDKLSHPRWTRKASSLEIPIFRQAFSPPMGQKSFLPAHSFLHTSHPNRAAPQPEHCSRLLGVTSPSCTPRIQTVPPRSRNTAPGSWGSQDLPAPASTLAQEMTSSHRCR